MAKDKAITLSPKQLGELAKPDACPRCFWIGAQMKHKYPFSMFPGIFATLDSYQKAISSGLIAQGQIPRWLQTLNDIDFVEPPMHWSKFSITLPNGVVFRGVPDTMIRMKDRSLMILDEKTATPKEPGDALERLYDAQLNGYAKIANQLGLGPVSKLAIVYNVPVKIEDGGMTVDAAVRADRYIMEFVPQVRVVPIEPEWVDGLIDKACGIMLKSDCPTGNPGCSNCALIDSMACIVKHGVPA